MELLESNAFGVSLIVAGAILCAIPMIRFLYRRLSQRETRALNLKFGSTPAVADIRKELRRAHRHSTLVSILIVEFPGLMDVARRTGLPYVEGTQRDLINIMHARLRGDDQLCTLEVGKYLLILPGTDEVGSRQVRARLSESLQHYRVSQRLNVIGGVRVADAVSVSFKRLTSRPGNYVTPEKLFQQMETSGDRLERPSRHLAIDGLQATGTDKSDS